jgi:hypothetical protein
MSKQIDASISSALAKQALQFQELWAKQFGGMMPETRQTTQEGAAEKAEIKIAADKATIKIGVESKAEAAMAEAKKKEDEMSG